MPEAVKNFIETNDSNSVREIQNEILRAYDRDISKHAPTEQVMRINQVWASIPSQLAKENKMQTLRNVSINYYSKENSQLELDFVIQLGTHIYPIEVKAEENLQAKSLKTTLANNPTLVGLRFSMNDYREQDRLTNVPLYGINAYLETKKDI